MKSVPFVLAVVLAGTGVARADQCQLVDSGTAVRALQLLHDHPNVLAYCEPCGDHAPGTPTRAEHVATDRDRSGAYQVVIDRREVDLAYTFVQTGPDQFENLAHLTGCPASGVSATLAIHVPEETHDAIVIQPPPRAAEPPRTTYVVTERHTVSFITLLGTCLATSAACTLGLFVVLRRRRLAMRPRAIALVDRDKS